MEDNCRQKGDRVSREPPRRSSSYFSSSYIKPKFCKQLRSSTNRAGGGGVAVCSDPKIHPLERLKPFKRCQRRKVAFASERFARRAEQVVCGNWTAACRGELLRLALRVLDQLLRPARIIAEQSAAQPRNGAQCTESLVQTVAADHRGSAGTCTGWSLPSLRVRLSTSLAPFVGSRNRFTRAPCSAVFTLKMETISSSETSVNNQKLTRRIRH
jgi:hypothetical protein